MDYAIGIDIQSYLITSEIADHSPIMQISATGKPNTRPKLNHRIIIQKGLKNFMSVLKNKIYLIFWLKQIQTKASRKLFQYLQSEISRTVSN